MGKKREVRWIWKELSRGVGSDMIKLLLYEILEQLIKVFQMSICQHAHSHQALGNQSNTEMPRVINFTVSEIKWKNNTDVGIEERELEPFHTSQEI